MHSFRTDEHAEYVLQKLRENYKGDLTAIVRMALDELSKRSPNIIARFHGPPRQTFIECEERTKPVGFILPYSTHARLRQMAEKHKVPMSSIVRNCIDQLYEDEFSKRA